MNTNPTDTINCCNAMGKPLFSARFASVHSKIAVADQGSFLKAAKELYITPASVMNQMNKLESIVGIKLIERTNQGARLTATGHSIYQDAKHMIEFSNTAIEKARQLAAAEQNVIRVGTSILRPCKRQIVLWADIDDGSQPFQIRIVPFDDEPNSLNAVLSSLVSQIDCFVSPCDSMISVSFSVSFYDTIFTMFFVGVVRISGTIIQRRTQ